MGTGGRYAPNPTLIALVLTAMTLAGCTSKPARLFPAVPAEDQIDLTGYTGKPCTLLPTGRVAPRHLNPPGKLAPTPTGSVCQWNSTDPRYPSITVQASVDRGLESIYRRRPNFTYFQPTQVSHYPAVDTTSGGRGPSSGICSVAVDVADGAMLTVTADYGNATSTFSADPCPDAADVAFEIISRIRSGDP